MGAIKFIGKLAIVVVCAVGIWALTAAIIVAKHAAAQPTASAAGLGLAVVITASFLIRELVVSRRGSAGGAIQA